MWNVPDWQKVVFSDESRFVLWTDDNRVRMWRRPAYDSRSTLIVMRGTLTGQRYVDDILLPHVGPFLNGLPGAIFQQNNARPHTVESVPEFDKIVNAIYEHIHLTKQINSEVDRDDAREMLDSHNQGLTIDELIEMLGKVESGGYKSGGYRVDAQFASPLFFYQELFDDFGCFRVSIVVDRP
ncbi:transposable element Tcb2 transposase [Trichonephila clavipes]|nr:transposable element Tcb2 transposase [Trichonephila clavipes]